MSAAVFKWKFGFIENEIFTFYTDIFNRRYRSYFACGFGFDNDFFLKCGLCLKNRRHDSAADPWIYAYE